MRMTDRRQAAARVSSVSFQLMTRVTQRSVRVWVILASTLALGRRV